MEGSWEGIAGCVVHVDVSGECMGSGNIDTSEDEESHKEHCLKVILVQHLKSEEEPVLFIFASKCHTITQYPIRLCVAATPTL